MNIQENEKRPEIVKKKPGRPAKYRNAMSATDRSRERRKREAEKEQTYKSMLNLAFALLPPGTQGYLWHFWSELKDFTPEIVDQAFGEEDRTKYEALAEKYLSDSAAQKMRLAELHARDEAKKLKEKAVDI